MAWYYKDADQEKGPVGKAELQELIKSKQIGSKTLVRSVEKDDWIPLIDAVRGKPTRPQSPPPPPADDEPFNKMEAIETKSDDDIGDAASSAICSQCGRSLPIDQVIAYDDQQICAACKPMFVQKLKEGAVLPATLNYGGFWIRFVAKIIDGIILTIAQWAIMIPTSMLIAPPMTQGQEQFPTPDFFIFMGVQIIIGITIPLAYSTFFLGRFGATLGKMACRLQVVTAEGGKITYMRAFGRFCAEMISYLILTIGYIMVAFDDEKRALHDRICSTRVVKKI